MIAVNVQCDLIYFDTNVNTCDVYVDGQENT